jgi:O-antigen ligase
MTWLQRALIVTGLVLLSLALARAPLTLCAALVFGSLAALWLTLHPTWGLYVLALSVPFGSLRTFDLGGARVGPSELVLALMLAAWLMRGLAHRSLRLTGSPLAFALALWLGAAGLALLPAMELKPALVELAKWAEVLALLLFVSTALNARSARWLVVALLVGGLLQASLGIYQFLRQVGPPGFILLGRYMRAYGTFWQPNPFGGYMGLLLPLGYGMALTAWRKHPDCDSPSYRWRMGLGLLGLISSAFMGAALLMSWSRGALLGAACGLALVTLALGRRQWFVMLAGLPLLLLLAPELTGLLPGGFAQRLVDSFTYVGQDLTLIEVTDESFAVIERAAHWQAAWRMFSAQPWLGVGLGQYPVRYAEVAAPRWQDPLGHAHNYYLHVLAETGLVGLVAYGGAQLAALRQAWRSLRDAQGWRRGVMLGTLGMLGHLAGHSLVDNLYVQGMYLTVAMLLGMVVALRHPSPAPAMPEARHPQALR